MRKKRRLAGTSAIVVCAGARGVAEQYGYRRCLWCFIGVILTFIRGVGELEQLRGASSAVAAPLTITEGRCVCEPAVLPTRGVSTRS